MFFEAVVAGLRILSRWQVWVAVVTFSLLNLGFLLLATWPARGNPDEVERKAGLGRLLEMVGGPLLHGILMSVMIYFLLPTLMGGADLTPALETASLLWHVFLAGAKAVAIVVVLGLIPFLGDFIVDSVGMRAFLTGVLVFRFMIAPTVEPLLAAAEAGSGIYPGLWVSLGFVVIAAVLEKLALLISALILIPFEGRKPGEVLPIVIAPALVFLAGIIPLLMYTSYVRLLLEPFLS